MRWIEAIERVLEESDEPLHSAEIARLAVQNGWAKTQAEFPDYTVQAAILRHIKDNGNAKGFVTIAKGQDGHFYWLARKTKEQA
jgi:hypothetical protein